MQTKYYHRNLTWIFKKEDSKEYKNDFLEMMKQRHRNVKVACAQMMPLNQSHYLQSSHIYWMQKQNIAYCPSFKSATTTWFNILIKLTNHSEAYLKRVRTELNRKWAPIPAHLRYLGAIKVMATKVLPKCYLTDVAYVYDAKTNIAIFSGIFNAKHSKTPRVSLLPPPTKKSVKSDYVYRIQFVLKYLI